ncbi:MAG TPA: phosphotransferase family protein [Steroidobacteraceae bacterium]|jgi:aminoglycoside phosphotransferase (APT) family kinase protein
MTSGSEQDADFFESVNKNAKAGFQQVDRAKLASFLQSRPDVIGPVQILATDLLSGSAGASNGIALVKAEMDVGDGRRLHEFILRYAAGVKLFKQKRFEDEFDTLKAAHAAGIPVPKPLWLDAEGTQVGYPSFVMEKIDGEAVPGMWFSRGPLAAASPAERNSLMLDVAGFHGLLRRTAIRPEAVPRLTKRGQGRTAIERELNWIFEEAKLMDQPEDPSFHYVQKLHVWMIDHEPATRLATLVHGDAQVANAMFRNGRVVAGIDWELAYLGHGEADLAWLIRSTELQQLFGGPASGAPTAQEYIVRFEAESGSLVEHWEYFQLFNRFKMLCVTFMLKKAIPSFDTVWKLYTDEVEEIRKRMR